MRKIAREVAFKLVYAFLIQNETEEAETSELVAAAGLDEADVAYLKDVYYGVADRREELTELIAAQSVGYSLARIYRIDLAILLVAVYEMKYRTDVPHKVSINEAVELAKIYSTERSGKFVNGVLGGIEKKWGEEDQCPQSI